MKPALAAAILASLLGAARAAEGPTPLDKLLAEAAAGNPDILAARRAWQAAEQLPSQASTPPDPEVTVQQFAVGSPRPFAGITNSDMAYIGFGISQDLPYPGKLKLRGEAARTEASVTRQQLETVRRTVFEQVKEAYYQIAYVQRTMALLMRDEDLLDQIEKIVEARYRVGQGSQQDVLKAQLEKTRLLREMEHHNMVEGIGQARLRQLLNRPANTPAVVTEPLAQTPLTLTEDQLLDRIRHDNPEVTARRDMVNRQGLQVELARKDRYPDFNIQYMWQSTGPGYRDYYMLTFGARLPIYRKRKLDPELSQAVDELHQSKQQYESQLQSTAFNVRSELISAQTTGRVLKIYSEGLMPQAMAAYRAGLAAYETNREDFQTLLNSFRDVVNFDEEYWKLVADRETSLARIEQWTGAQIH
jgi:cobalt-zinc-cadmium efflux system outer membrane protein